MDLNKKQRRLMDAAKQAPTEQAVRDDQRFCTDCQAVLTARGTCPKCNHQQKTFLKFCRNCLHVHGSLTTCKRWSPRETN